MNAKENALRIIQFDQPEYVMMGLPTFGMHYHGCNHESFPGEGGEQGDGCPVGSQWSDIWGTGWHKVHEGVMGLPKFSPLAEVPSLNSYEWPSPDDERICGLIHQTADSFPGDDRFLTGSHRDTLWEKAYMLVGMENLMIYFYTEPGFVRHVLHRIMDFQLGIAVHYLERGVEFVSLGDDLGTQLGPLVSPDLIEEFFVPEYQRLFGLYREHGVLIGFHSCGNIEPMLDVFMRLGVDVLNPVQATANDLERVRTKTLGRMALQGGVSSATIMAGPVEQIMAEVGERIWRLGQRGGYFCAADQGMPYPPEHAQAVHAAVQRYGKYPVQPLPALS